MLASRGKLKNIFAGAAAAFVIQSLISVLLGGVLVLLPQLIIQLTEGVLFIFFGYSFWKQSQTSLNLKDSERDISAKSVFFIVFMAEFGDVSQLAIATTAANSSSKLSVFVLGVLALWAITGVALFFGHNLKRLIKPSFIQKIAGLVFFIIGIVLFIQALV
jgi:putative Ca2+/H+ antiporter (TMEM165/GDT1 family)